MYIHIYYIYTTCVFYTILFVYSIIRYLLFFLWHIYNIISRIDTASSCRYYLTRVSYTICKYNTSTFDTVAVSDLYKYMVLFVLGLLRLTEPMYYIGTYIIILVAIGFSNCGGARNLYSNPYFVLTYMLCLK